MFFKKSDFHLVVIAFLLTFALKSNGQIVTNQGRDFWVVFPCHLPTDQAHLGQLRLYITSTSDSKGVYMIGAEVYPFSVSGNTIYVSPNIDRDLAYLANSSSYSQKGIHVVIDSDQPEVVVYAHMFAAKRSAATLVLPTTIIGSQYYVMGYDQEKTAGGKFTYTIAATQANTTVLIHPRKNNISLGGTPIKVTLANAGDVYQFLGDDDYTGTYIEIDPSTPSQTFAVFSGSSGTVIPITCFDSLQNNRSYDPLFQQLYPVNFWGKEYAYVPFSGPDAGDFIRVIAQEDNTTVSIGGASITLDKGQFYTTPNPVTTEQIISSDKLISVAQIALSQYCASTNHGSTSSTESDPDMVILNPIKNRTKDATTYSSVQEQIDNQFINIVIPTAAASSFKVNGNLPISATFSQLGTSKYAYMQLDVAPYNTSVPKKSINIHLTADDGFNAVVYGFGAYESYAYSAGISQPDICSDPDLPAITIPNVFTPNGDGLNDVWTITNISNYPQCVVHIFNRWGTLLYSSNGYQHPWDGTFNGLSLPVATYYYVIDLQDCKALHAGYIAIIR